MQHLKVFSCIGWHIYDSHNMFRTWWRYKRHSPRRFPALPLWLVVLVLLLRHAKSSFPNLMLPSISLKCISPFQFEFIILEPLHRHAWISYLLNVHTLWWLYDSPVQGKTLWRDRSWMSTENGFASAYQTLNVQTESERVWIISLMCFVNLQPHIFSFRAVKALVTWY